MTNNAAELSDICRCIIERKIGELKEEILAADALSKKQRGTLSGLSSSTVAATLRVKLETLQDILQEADLIDSMVSHPLKNEEPTNANRDE
jgi:predicted DNA-binding protein